MVMTINNEKIKKENELQDRNNPKMSADEIAKSVEWHGMWVDIGLWVFKVLGILITAFGISQGSSLWYDTIKQFAGLRTGVVKQETENQQK